MRGENSQIPRGAAAIVLALLLSGCGGVGKGAQEAHEREHPCQFSATSLACRHHQAAERKREEARGETGKLLEARRLEAERKRLKEELSR